MPSSRLGSAAVEGQMSVAIRVRTAVLLAGSPQVMLRLTAL